MSDNLILEFAIFALIGVGFLARRLSIVSKEGQKSLTNLVVDVILPCNIFKAFLSADLERIRDDGLWVAGVCLIFTLLCVGLGRLLFRRRERSEGVCLRFAALCSNAGFMGNPVAEGLFGAEGLALANVYLIPMRIIMWSAGIALFSGSHDWKATTRKVLTHPCIIAVALGLAGMLLRLELPELLMKPIGYLSACNTAASMLVIGMILARIRPRQFLDGSVLAFSLLRLVLLPAGMYALCLPLPMSDMARSLCVLLAAMPVAANTSILADRYDGNSVYATKLVVVSTLLSIPTTALWSLILIG